MTYHTSNEEHAIDIVNVASLETKVRDRMEKGVFGYIRGGAEDEWTMRENTRSFQSKKIYPRVLKGIDHADFAVGPGLGYSYYSGAFSGTRAGS